MGNNDSVSHPSRRPCGPPRGEAGGATSSIENLKAILDKYLSNSYKGTGANQAAVAVAREQCRCQTMQEAAGPASAKRLPHYRKYRKFPPGVAANGCG